ncbi:hypothetical protein NECAME_08580 [Necator americanus]|uniref:Uncharacterized protein n=1 Tax=Necator americanus TaxID=51031 RepID=W2THP6_NECAM|nr:hypothetical protein NECAME_08580 [Necator americanus]ETN81323.1 hypothetical protein NECAME_08580 [Necator americanus]
MDDEYQPNILPTVQTTQTVSKTLETQREAARTAGDDERTPPSSLGSSEKQKERRKRRLQREKSINIS